MRPLTIHRKREKQLASSRDTSNGPDWKDIALALEAVGLYHNVVVDIRFTAPKSGLAGSLQVTATASRKGCLPPGVRPSVCRSFLIGSNGVMKDTARIFRLVHELDRDCGQMWEQEVLNLNV